MQRFDFSKTGGFPLSQNRLAWLQDSYINALNAIGAMSGATQPVVLTGVEITSTANSTTVTDGWVWHPTLGIMPFLGGTFSNAFILVVLFQDLKTPLVFKNNSSQLVQISRVATVGPPVIGQQGNTNLGQLSARRWYKEFNKQGRDQAWTSFNSTFLGCVFSFSYKNDTVGNFLKLKGTINVAANIQPPYNFAVAAPAGVSAAGVVHFSGVVERISATSYPNTMVGSVTTGGQIGFSSPIMMPITHIQARLDATSLIFELQPCSNAYTVHFNCLLNTD